MHGAGRDKRHGRTVAGVSTPVAVPSRRARSLARSVTATWWYTASSVVFVHAMVLFVWLAPAVLLQRAWPIAAVVLVYLVGSALTLAGAVALLVAYRLVTTGDEDAVRWWPPNALVWSGLAVAVAGAAVVGVAAGSVLIGVALAVYALCLLRWPLGLRLRFLLVTLLALIVLWAMESPMLGAVPELTGGYAIFLPGSAVALPLTAVFTMWWWDVVVELDRARAAESRLAATQERLRLASDLHDLQGHHLQVIALQLELAERMLTRDPPAALEQVRLARASVDAARDGTRELAGRFRGVPLPDELANAADLLRAAGVDVRLEVDATARRAPADVLGPVVRECTTNVLKHGGGRWALLALAREGSQWRLRVANDIRRGGAGLGSGLGLDGIAERVGAVGGDLRTRAGEEEFEVVVTVPAADEEGETA
jgi:two-component system, NarL family, sensor histidine kinase DesK